MRMECITCHRTLHLDHPVFEEYQGPVKCFHCGTVMDVDISGGTLHASALRESEFPLAQNYLSGADQIGWPPQA